MEREWPTSLFMFVLYRAAEDRIFDAVAQAGEGEITRAQGRLLAGLDPAGTRVVVLADRARIAKQTAVSLVDKLEAAGLVERAVDPADGRARLVRLTARGEKVLPLARVEEQRIDEDWTRVLGERRMRELRRALEDLWSATEPNNTT